MLTVRRNANEVYLLPAPEELIGRDLAEVSEMFVRHREDRRSCLLMGVQRGDEMVINPIGDEAGPLQASDQLIVFSRIYPTGGPAAAGQTRRSRRRGRDKGAKSGDGNPERRSFTQRRKGPQRRGENGFKD